MDENGTFIALISINLGGIGLLGAYALAKYFFYVERFTDLKAKIKSDLSLLKVSFGIAPSGSKVSKSIFDLIEANKRVNGDLLQLHLENRLHEMSEEDSFNRSLFNNNYKANQINDNYINLLNLMIDCILDAKESKTLNNKIDFKKENEIENILKELKNLNEVLEFIEQHNKSEIFLIGENKLDKILEINKNNEEEEKNLIINKYINLQNQIFNIKKQKIEELIVNSEKYIELSKKQSNIGPIYFIFPVIFGILIPVCLISALPYDSINYYFNSNGGINPSSISSYSYDKETSGFDLKIDVSIVVAYFLTFISLASYIKVIRKIWKDINSNSTHTRCKTRRKKAKNMS